MRHVRLLDDPNDRDVDGAYDLLPVLNVVESVIEKNRNKNGDEVFEYVSRHLSNKTAAFAQLNNNTTINDYILNNKNADPLETISNTLNMLNPRRH